MDLGLERAGMRVEWQVENNEYARKVLQKHWPKVPCHYDITTIDWRFIQPVDLICGGFPCQPFSCAGKQRGKDDARYLWPEVVRCLTVLRPAWFLGENVPGLLHLGIERVCADLEALGYQVAVLGIPACAVDAPHIRQRLWLLAHASRKQSDRERRTLECGRNDVGRSEQTAQQDQWQASDNGVNGCGEDVADASIQRLQSAACRQVGSVRGEKGPSKRRQSSRGNAATRNSWPVEPAVGRSSDGLPHWLDGHIGKGMSYAESQRALKTLRTLWKPHVAKAIWKAAGGLDRISQAEVLFAIVREHKKDAHQTRVLLASQEALETFVRSVWREATTSRSSRRSRQDKQRSAEHSDTMQMVSQLPSCDTETTWPVLGWEDGLARVASGVEYRVHRLKGLGNAVVPAIVEHLGRMILAAETLNRIGKGM